MQANVKARDAADEECGRLLDILDEVRTFRGLLRLALIFFFQAQAKWDEIPVEEVQSWALQTAESINSTALR